MDRFVDAARQRPPFQHCPNPLGREFLADHPNQKWADDLSYGWTHKGWLYLALAIVLGPMADKGNCYDNAAVETFYKTIKADIIWQ